MRETIAKSAYTYTSELFKMMGLDGENASTTQRIIMVAVMFALAYITQLIFRKIVSPITLKIVAKTKAKWDDYIFSDKMQQSVSRTMPSLVIYAMLPLVLYGEDILLIFCMKASKIYIVISLLSIFSTFLDGVKDATEEHNKYKDRSMSSVFQLFKLVAYFIGAIIIVSIIINRSPLSLIAGLGAAATILMLVFKDTIVGFVSGIQLTANDMLRKGDWIQMDKNGANGIVQDVNITTVKVKNWDNTITTISPFTLMNDSFRNWRGMQNSAGRLATPTLTIDMNSMALVSDEQKAEYLANNLISESEMQKPIVNLTVYQRAMLKYLQSDERINTQYNHMVRQIPSPTQGMGMTIQLYFFLKDKKWENYERNKDEILSYAIVALKHYGLEIYQLQKLA